MEENKNNGFSTINPANGKTIDKYSHITDSEAKQAVKNCHEAYLEWRLRPIGERGKIIAAIGKGLQDRKREFVELMTREMGKLIKHGEQEIDLCSGICEYTAAQAPEQLADEERELPDGGKGIITYSPIGVIYGIQPWNFPAYQAVRYSIANLMAGNGVLLKHAENVSGSAILLQEIYEDAGLPKNLFTVLLIDHEQSDRIIANELVRGVTLTGSEEAGRHVAEKAGAVLKKTVLELGSNDAYIVLSDADIPMAATTCANGRIYNNGETCVAAKRFIVVDSVYDEFRNAFVERMKNIKMGDPTDENTDLGPMARKDLREKLVEQVKESVDKGAKIAVGGEVPDGEGYFYPSTILEYVALGQPAYDDELFGPVASLIRAEDDEEAMEIANQSRFGLGGGIFSRDERKAIKLATRHFDTGMVFVNSFGLAQPNMPFGGVKNSGYGREHGGFGVREFVNAKAVMVLGSE